MKKHIFITIVLLVFICSSCKPEYENLNRDDIIGKWKLVEVTIFKTYYQPYERQSEITDYSNDTIIYDFQSNKKLVVSGVIIDTLSLFECFKEGEHFYEYIKHPDPPSGRNAPIPEPGTNLSIDKPVIGEYYKRFYCTALKGEQTMTIGTGQPDGNEWGFSFKLIIIK